ncbi:unnamed protein product [Caenorhabditis brenneri]
MSLADLRKWSAEPINAKLIEFLIEKTRNARSPISCRRLAEEFYTSTHLTNGVKAIQQRIDRIRSKVFDLEDIDWKTKVKLLFVLSVPVDKELIQSKIKGTFRFDEKRRITYYKSFDGVLVLEGDHTPSRKEGVKMPVVDLRKWSAEPINAKLIKFLIEEIKKAQSPISCRRLAEEFIASTHLTNGVKAIQQRIDSIRSKVFDLENLDTETKVKLLFVLSAPVDVESIGSKIKGEFRFDDKKRVIYYKSMDGNLKLEGNHDPRRKEGASEMFQSSRELIKEFFANRENPVNGSWPIQNERKNEFRKFIGFVFEKCKNISSPLVLAQFYDEYNALYRLTRNHSALHTRIKVYCREIQNVNSLDTPTKVEQLFGLSGSLTDECLDELCQNALVRVDELKRITEYKSNDGSLLLRGKHDCYSKRLISGNDRRTSGGRFVKLTTQAHAENLKEDPEEEELSNDSDDGIDSYFDDNDDHQISRDDNEETGLSEKNKKLTRKQRRPDDADFSDDLDTPDFQSTSSPRTAHRSSKINCSERTSSIPKINTPLKTSNKRKTHESNTDTHKRARKSNNAESNAPPSDGFGLDDLENYDPNHSSVHSNLEMNGGVDGEVRDEQNRLDLNQDARQNSVNRTVDASNAPETSENPRPVVPIQQDPEELVQVKEETITEKEEDVKPTLSPNRAPILQILQGLHTLVVSLYHPSLEKLQKEIEERMKRFEGSGTSIPIVQVLWTMELCFSKMTESSVRISSEGPQFINLRDFLCYLKSFILNLKVEELKSVMDKTNECMQGCQHKRVRVKKVEEILRVTLDNITI